MNLNPPDEPELKLFSGDVFLTVCVVCNKAEAHSAGDLEQSTLEALKNQLSTNSSEVSRVTIELEDSDLIQVDRAPDWWDRVDEARDRMQDR